MFAGVQFEEFVMGDTAKKHGFALSLWLTAGKCKWIRYASLVKVVMLESH